jgi:hypothetical protein
MSGYLQVQGDPTQWWLAQAVQSSQLTGQVLSVEVEAPLAGTLLLSPNSAGVAVFDQPGTSTEPSLVENPNPVIYLPTTTGPSTGSVGYELPASVDLANLASEITALMQNGGKQTIALGASGASLVLNGATLSFVVLCPATATSVSSGTAAPAGGAVPHD